jgi:hypothetical protein
MARLLTPIRPPIRFGADGKVHRIVIALTPVDTHLQRRFFGFDRNRMPPVSESDMGRILREMRTAPDLEPFHLWLVGSRLESGKEPSDIDLVLSPRNGFCITDLIVEQALCFCRNFGLYESKPACVVDPCYRPDGPTRAVAALCPQAVLKSCKLCSPQLAKLAERGLLLHYRRFGKIGIEFFRWAGDTSFYEKLPRQVFEGSPSAYLRPAVEIPILAD